MATRNRLLSTTMLSGIVGGTLLNGPAIQAADLSNLYKAPPAAMAAPAIDGFNEKFDAFGGSIANKSVYGVEGAIGNVY